MHSISFAPIHELSPRAYLEASETIIALEAKFALVVRELKRIGGTPETACQISNDAGIGRIETAINDRARRTRVLPPCLFGEPAWDILLALYRGEIRGARSSVSAICSASGAPATTALRWLASLEAERLVRRDPDSLDRRRVYLQLTEKGSRAMALYFSSSPGSPERMSCTQ